MAPAWVLNEDEALELVAYLVTAARTQVDESAEYGPLRLLTAARRLMEVIDPRASEETREYVNIFRDLERVALSPDRSTARRNTSRSI